MSNEKDPYQQPTVEMMAGHSEQGQSVYLQLDSWIGRLANFSHRVASQFCLLFMTGIIALEVVRRYVFNAGLTWSQEVCGLAFFLMVFLCQADTWQRDRHIRMDIFYNNFNRFFKGVSDVLTIICGLILYSVLAWQGISELQYQFQIGEGTVELMWPLWPFSLVMVYSCVLVLLLLLRFAGISIFRRKG